MSTRRLILAIVVVFVGVWLTNFLIHGLWLQSTYKETMNLWRTEDEMRTHMGWLMLGQLLFATIFAVIWSKGFPVTASLGGSCLYGLCMGLFSQASTLVDYAVQPLPSSLAVKWFVAGLAQGVFLGILIFFVGKPKPAEGKPQK